MIRRKDTLGFVDFMRGKYSIYNKEYILNMIKQMTNDEKSRLITDPFSKLWNDLWGGSVSKPAAASTAAATPNETLGSARTPERISEAITEVKSVGVRGLSREDLSSKDNANRQLNYKDPYKAEEQNSRNKFESLRSGVYTKTNSYNLEELVQMTEQNWTEPEWGFPKGRRNYQEKDYDCAVREFCEETGYSPDKLIPLKNIQPFEEIFTGSNYKSYKHKYYVTYMKYEDTLSSRRLQVCEVSESSWMAIEECDAAIRPYNVEKKRLLVAVDKMLSSNHLSQINC
jgi:8-oxo-dGTP pyrophosphatase MutT (NUDIX family)